MKCPPGISILAGALPGAYLSFGVGALLEEVGFGGAGADCGGELVRCGEMEVVRVPCCAGVGR